MNWRLRARRFLPYAIAATAGFIVAYLVVALFIFPSEIVPTDEIVPNVVGLEYDEAVQRLSASGFRPAAGEQRFHAAVPRMSVLEQSPAAGTREQRGARVVLTISGGQQRATVPPVAGMARQEAIDALRDAGFNLGSIVQRTSNLPRGQVIESSPVGGSRVLMPSSIDLVLSSGPASVQVPDLVGRDLNQARTMLEQIGLRWNVEVNRFSPDPPNTVVEQTPRPGSTVGTGSRISLTISGRAG